MLHYSLCFEGIKYCCWWCRLFRLDNGYLNRSVVIPRFNSIDVKGLPATSQRQAFLPSSSGNNIEYVKENGFSPSLDPSQFLPFIPYSGAKLGARNMEVGEFDVKGKSHQPQDPAIHLLDRFSKLQNNEYEVPFSHYSSANNICTKLPPSSFQPTPAMFSRVTAGFKPYILSQNSGDSLPNIIDTKSYIHLDPKKGLNEKIDYDLPLASWMTDWIEPKLS